MEALLVVGARVWAPDAGRPPAQAVGVVDGRIAAVGTAQAVAQRLGARVRRIELPSGLIVPGFHDAHTHLLYGGLYLAGADLEGVCTIDAFQRRVAQAHAASPPGEWLLGAGWDPALWADGRLTRDLLDALVPGRPCLLLQADLHSGLANETALRRAGIDAGTPDPPGGEIVRVPATGEPVGLLRETALTLVSRCVPQSTRTQRRAAVQAGIRRAAAAGVTTVHEICAADEAQLYHDLARAGELGIGFNLMVLAGEWDWDRLEALRCRTPAFRCETLKAFIDGSLGSRTAWMDEPYDDRPGWRGQRDAMAADWDEFVRRAREADRRGWQLALHAIGTRANHAALDLAETLRRERGARDRRLRIEHAQHLRREDVPRFAASGTIASVQPLHLCWDGRWAEGAIGAQRGETSYAFRSLLVAGARLAFGSDWPVARLDPLAAVHAAVERRLIDGERVWMPAERLTVEQSLRCVTVGAAYAAFGEDDGGLRVGGPGDLTVLSHDVLAQPDALNETRVVTTIHRGRIVHDAR